MKLKKNKNKYEIKKKCYIYFDMFLMLRGRFML